MSYRVAVALNGETVKDLPLEGPLGDVTVRVSRRALWHFFLRGGLVVSVRTASLSLPASKETQQ